MVVWSQWVGSTVIDAIAFKKQTNKKTTTINCYISENGYLSFKTLEGCSWIMLVFPRTIISLECKNIIIIICYSPLKIFSFNPHRSPVRWLLLLPTFYYERSIERGLKKVVSFVSTAKTLPSTQLDSPHMFFFVSPSTTTRSRDSKKAPLQTALLHKSHGLGPTAFPYN